MSEDDLLDGSEPEGRMFRYAYGYGTKLFRGTCIARAMPLRSSAILQLGELVPRWAIETLVVTDDLRLDTILPAVLS